MKFSRPRQVAVAACLLATFTAVSGWSQPAVSGVGLHGAPASGGTFRLAEAITVRVTFDQAVDVTGSPQLALTIGSATRQASFDRQTGGTSLWFVYFVQSADSDTNGFDVGASALGLNGGTIKAAGRTTNATLGLGRHALTGANTYQVNGSLVTAPTVNQVLISGTPPNNTYGLTETIWVGITFDRAVAVTGTPQLALTIGAATRQANYVSGANVGYLWFRYVVQPSDSDTDGISIAATALALNGGTIRIRGGTTNATLGLGSQAIANSASHKVDGSQQTAPRVSAALIGSSPASGDTYGLVEAIWVRITFDRPVDVAGTPRLALAIGTATRQADYHSGSATRHLWFRYIVEPSDSDTDGISVGSGALALNGGTIRIRGGTANATLGLGGAAIANSANHKVDGSSEIAPTVSGVSIGGAPASGDTYGLGEPIWVQVTFIRPVDVTGSPQLALTIGSSTRQARYHSGNGSSTLSFLHVVQSSDVDADGLSVGASALTLNSGTITIRGGTTGATLGLGAHAIANSTNHKVNGGTATAPTVASVSVAGGPASGDTYGLAEAIRIRIGFDRAVDVTGTPQLALTIGSANRQANFSAQTTSGFTLTFQYRVQAQDADADGLSIGAAALALNGGGITLRGGTANATLGLGSHAIANSANHKVDGSRQAPPTVSDIALSPGPASGDTYTLAEAIWVRITFDRAVDVLVGGLVVASDVAGAPRLALAIGSATRQASYSRGSSSNTLWFRHVVRPSDRDADGISIGASALTLDNGTIRVSGGATNAVLGLGSHAIVNAANHKVDGSQGATPTVSSVVIAGGPASGDTYGLGEVIRVQVGFDRAVNVTGAPTLALTIGATARAARHAAQTAAGFILTFEHVVLPADMDADGISIAAGALTLNSGTIKIRGGAANATLGLGSHAIANSTNHKVNGGTATAPTVTSVAIAGNPANGHTYGLFEAIRVRIGFDRAVDVTGAPQLALAIGSATRQAHYDGGSGGSALWFRYAVQSPDRDADGIGIAANALTLNGGTIRVSGGNTNAALGLGTPALANYRVDGSVEAPPTVSGVAVGAAPASGDTYTLGEAIRVRITFSRPVDVAGTPRLALTVGSATRQASYESGAGSGSLWFAYVVQASDRDADGISIGASALTNNGGAIRIKDGTANAALGLGSHAIANSANHKVDGSQAATPAIQSVVIAGGPASGDTYRSREAIQVQIGFDRAVDVTGAPTLTLTIGAATQAARLAAQTATGFILTFEHIVLPADLDADGISIGAGALTLNGGTIKIRGGTIDATLGLGSRAIANSANHKVNGSIGAPPTVSSVAISGSPASGAAYALGEAIFIQVRFDRAVDVTGTPALTLTIGAAARQASYVSQTANGLTLTFRYVVQLGDLDADGISVGAGALSGGTIRLRGGTMNAVLDLSSRSIENAANHRVDGGPLPPNQPPVAIGTVDDLDLDVGGTARIQLLGLFDDEVVAQLSHTVKSSNPAAVSVRVSWLGFVELVGLADGMATVEITAWDPDGLSASQVFAVQVGMAVSFAGDAAAPEGGVVRLTLVASRPARQALPVPYHLAPGTDPATAADAADHAGGAGGTATIAAGETQAVVEVRVLDDDVVDPVREHFVATLAEPAADAGYGLGMKTSAVAVIEEGVCDRTAAVRDALRKGRPCAAVADLSRHTALRLPAAGLARLQVEDLLELGRLRLLDLSDNRLTAWPAEPLGALPLLMSLRLDGNRIQSLPAVLGPHPALLELRLSGNGLAELPAAALRGLGGLEWLDLSDNALAALPAATFDGLAALKSLRLDGNALAELPAGLFSGLARLEELQLAGNPGAPFTLTAELVRTDAEPWAPGPAAVAIRVATGAPFTLRGALNAPAGSLPDGARVSVPAGSTEGVPVAVVADGALAVVLQLLEPPRVPEHECEHGEGRYRPCFQGVATAIGPPLVLFKRPPVAKPVPEQALDTDDAMRLNLATVFGAPGETLAFAAESSEPTVARARMVGGELVVEALQEGMATITVTATDRAGLTATLRFEVRTATPVRSRWRGWRAILLRDAVQ